MSDFSTYVISLAEAVDRQEKMSHHLKELNLAYSLVEAVNGREQDLLSHPIYDQKKRLRGFGRDLKSTEIACALSHQKAWDIIAQSDEAFGLVLEDDARLSDDAPELINKTAAQYPDFELVRLFGDPRKLSQKGRVLSEIAPGCNLTKRFALPGGAHAYIVTKEAAVKLSNLMNKNKLSVPVDVLMGQDWLSNVQSLMLIKPGLSMQDTEMPSMIGHGRHDKTIHLKGLARTLFPLTRGIQKLSENYGKFLMFCCPRNHSTR